MKILEVTGKVIEAGRLDTCTAINPRGVRIDVKGEPVEFHGLDVHEARAFAALLGREVTFTVTTNAPLPGMPTS